jgi:hypothetical protein
MMPLTGPGARGTWDIVAGGTTSRTVANGSP